jgi:uncharacterized RDD family membrane protein YckC
MKYVLRRSLAYFIDCIVAFASVMVIIQWGILSHIRIPIGITNEWLMTSINMQLYVLFSISIPVWAYFTWFDSRKSKGTFGKRVFKLSVRDNDKRQLSLGTSFLRTLLKLLPWEVAHLGVIFPTPLYFESEPDMRLIPFIGISLFALYLLSIFMNEKKQTLYDMILGTRVVEKQLATK